MGCAATVSPRSEQESEASLRGSAVRTSDSGDSQMDRRSRTELTVVRVEEAQLPDGQIDGGPNRVAAGANRHGVLLLKDCLSALKVVEYLADNNEYRGWYDATRSAPLDGERIARAVDSAGLRITDVNDESDVVYTREEVVAQVVSRRGAVFVRLTHLGRLYASPPRYAKAECQVGEGSVVVQMKGWYRLTYLKSQQGFQLSRIDYLQEEGE